MDFSPAVLGAGISKALHERATIAVLRIGTDVFSRHDLASVSCFNFIAAANLSRVLKDLRVTSTRDVFDRVPPSALAVPTIGCIALAVLGAAFERKRLGGDHPLEAWVMHHRPTAGVITFQSLKAQAEHTPKGRSRKAHGMRMVHRQRRSA